MVNSLGYVECPHPTPSPDLTMSSPDGRFRVRVGFHELEALLDMCRESGDLETGGSPGWSVQRGARYRNSDTNVWGPPEDSVRRRTSFWRGTQGLQQQLDALWNSREYYLGEWHYHPRGAGQPSNGDKRQMVRIAESLDYNTPEPVLIVVGGSDWEVLGHVFPRHGTAIGLV